MNVYFDDTYWGCLREKDERQPGREIRCNVSFQWEGRMWQIPAVYLCPQGLVADLCCRIERQELTNFYEKWKEWEGEEPLLEQEKPFHRNFRVEAEADNMPLQKQSGCGCSYRPLDLIPQKEARESGRDMVEEMLMKSYGLDLTAGWTFWRQSFASCKPPQKLSLPLLPCSLPLLRFPISCICSHSQPFVPPWANEIYFCADNFVLVFLVRDINPFNKNTF